MPLYETAKYKVLEKEGKFELREYDSYYTAAIFESEPIGTKGFNEIFGYISGENADKEKISMTTPVINQLEKDSFTTEFVMPFKYKESSPPTPINEKITIKKNEQRQCAAVTFSGVVNRAKIEKYQEDLLHWLSKINRTPVGTFRLARYNPPFIPPPLRRNEILIDII